MEILRKAVSGPQKFKALKHFLWKMGQLVKPDDIIEATQSEADELVAIGRAVPCDLPETGVYIALQDICLPGRTEKFEAKRMERVELKAEDALRLMLDRSVIPEDEKQWRPRNARLKTDGGRSESLMHKRVDGIGQAEFEAKVSSLPSQKGRRP